MQSASAPVAAWSAGLKAPTGRNAHARVLLRTPPGMKCWLEPELHAT